MKKSEVVNQVLISRYLLKNHQGKVIEDQNGMFKRVAKAVAKVEKNNNKKYENKFYKLLSELKFLPNSPTLMNAGKKNGQLSACFVLPINDSLGSIFETLKQAALIHQSGGGTGFSFNNIRGKGASINSSTGLAAGPIAFIKIFDQATDAIKQGGVRRGANMAILNIDHNDIDDFINLKKDPGNATNFNISVGVSDSFMWDVIQNKSYAVKKMNLIVEQAWNTGDPGLIFLDRINNTNPTPKIDKIVATNPCGEQPLLAWESCNLGSMSLPKYVKNGVIDFKSLSQDVRLAVRFLDNVIDANHYPVDECKKITMANRKIGLGIMGFADLLLLLDIDYESDKAVEIAKKIMGFIEKEARSASVDLAKERGPFKNFKGSIWEQLGYPKIRNATVTTVAPTGTISVIAGVSSGCEPIFSSNIIRNVLDGQRFEEWHPLILEKAQKMSLDLNKIRTDDDVRKYLFKDFKSAHEIGVDAHINIQAAFQLHSDSAVSKTINLPNEATLSSIQEAYIKAFLSGCKGITVYRDKSKEKQVLEKGVFCPSC